MQISVPYKEMLKRHPKQVEEVLNKLSKSKSKDKDLDPNNYTWEYFWAISVLPINIQTLLETGKFTADNRLLEERIVGLEIRATKERKWARCLTEITPIPQEVFDYHMKGQTNGCL